MASNFADVKAFHVKFGLPHSQLPQLLEPDIYRFRTDFMAEELREFDEAMEVADLPHAADALIDLVYVAMGTAVMMGIPWQLLWDAVQAANMNKVRASNAEDERSVRKHTLDVVKPPGWQPPNIQYLLDHYAAATELRLWLEAEQAELELLQAGGLRLPRGKPGESDL